jgi:hypothetical protein
LIICKVSSMASIPSLPAFTQATERVNSDTLRAPLEVLTLFRELYSSSESRKLTIRDRGL